MVHAKKASISRQLKVDLEDSGVTKENYKAEMDKVINLKDLQIDLNPEEELQQLKPPSPTKKDEIPIFDQGLHNIDLMTGYPFIYQREMAANQSEVSSPSPGYKLGFNINQTVETFGIGSRKQSQYSCTGFDSRKESKQYDDAE